MQVITVSVIKTEKGTVSFVQFTQQHAGNYAMIYPSSCYNLWDISMTDTDCPQKLQGLRKKRKVQQILHVILHDPQHKKVIGFCKSHKEEKPDQASSQKVLSSILVDSLNQLS